MSLKIFDFGDLPGLTGSVGNGWIPQAQTIGASVDIDNSKVIIPGLRTVKHIVPYDGVSGLGYDRADVYYAGASVPSPPGDEQVMVPGVSQWWLIGKALGSDFVPVNSGFDGNFNVILDFHGDNAGYTPVQICVRFANSELSVGVQGGGTNVNTPASTRWYYLTTTAGAPRTILAQPGDSFIWKVFVRWGADSTGIFKLWVAKNGAPFVSTPDVNDTGPNMMSGDGGYFKQACYRGHVSGGAPANPTISAWSSGVLRADTEAELRVPIAGSDSFGYAPNGATANSNAAASARGLKVTAPRDGRVSHVRVRVKGTDTSPNVVRSVCAVHNDNGASPSDPSSQIVKSKEFNFYSNAAEHDELVPLVTPIDVVSGQIMWALWGTNDFGSVTQWLGDATPGTNQFYSNGVGYTWNKDFPQTPAPSNTTANRQRAMSIELVYEQTAGADQGFGSESSSLIKGVFGSEAAVGGGIASVTVAASPLATEVGTGADTGRLSLSKSDADHGFGADIANVFISFVSPLVEEEAAEPVQYVCGPFGLQMHKEMAPVMFAEDENANSLKGFLCALGSMFDEVWSLAKDVRVGDTIYPGWSVLVDLNRTPTKALPWLGQFVGVSVPPDLTDAQTRDFIRRTDGWRRGTLGSLLGAARQYLTGNKTVVFRERFGSAYRLLVITRTYETPDQTKVLKALLAQKPAGIVLEYHVVRGRTWLEVRDENASWGVARTNYGDWETMRGLRDVDVPATEPLPPAEDLSPGELLAPGG